MSNLKKAKKQAIKDIKKDSIKTYVKHNRVDRFIYNSF